jgi:hypothetical protein
MAPPLIIQILHSLLQLEVLVLQKSIRIHTKNLSSAEFASQVHVFFDVFSYFTQIPPSSSHIHTQFPTNLPSTHQASSPSYSLCVINHQLGSDFDDLSISFTHVICAEAKAQVQ